MQMIIIFLSLVLYLGACVARADNVPPQSSLGFSVPGGKDNGTGEQVPDPMRFSVRVGCQSSSFNP